MERKMVVTLKKYKIGEAPTDFAYWQSRPPIERLEALEEIRREYILWKYGTWPRFQRVCHVIKRP